MAKRGPKPKPTKILKLRGSWRAKKRPDYDTADCQKSEIPSMPRWLGSDAKREWKRLLPELKELGILNPVDQTIIAMLCQDLAEYRQSCETIQALKSPYISQPSGRVCRHPAYQLRDAAAERIRKLSSELGLSPAARASLTIVPKEKEIDDIDRIIALNKKRFFKNT